MTETTYQGKFYTRCAEKNSQRWDCAHCGGSFKMAAPRFSHDRCDHLCVPCATKLAAPQPAVRANQFAGTCRACGCDVAVGAGRIERGAGQWLVFHASCAAESTDVTEDRSVNTYDRDAE